MSSPKPSSALRQRRNREEDRAPPRSLDTAVGRSEGRHHRVGAGGPHRRALHGARQSEAAPHRRARSRRSADADDDGRELAGFREDHGARSDDRDAGAGRALRHRDHQGNVMRSTCSTGPSRSIGDGETGHDRALIIATGASARWLEIGFDESSGHGVSTCATCDGYFFRGNRSPSSAAATPRWRKRFTSRSFASKVTVIHRRDTLRASKIMQDKALAIPRSSSSGIGRSPTSRTAEGEVTSVVVRNLKTGQLRVAARRRIHRNRHMPNTELFGGDRAGPERLHQDASGTKTSVPGVFAAGDVQDYIYARPLPRPVQVAWRHRRRALPRRIPRTALLKLPERPLTPN